MSYRIVYFSGTGNTRAIAERLAERLDLKAHSIEEKLDWKAELSEASRIILLYPVYFSLPPMIFREFLAEHAELFEHKEVISIVTQMCYSGDGARVVEDFLPKSAKLIDMHHINMPNNIPNIPFVPIAPKGGIRRKVRRGLRRIDRIAKDIQAERFARRHCSAFAIKLGEVQRVGGSKSEQAKRSHVWVSDDCIKCGLCVRACPTQNFVMGETKAEPQGKCILCLRCENKCPKKTISVILNKPVKRQYPGPVVR